MPRRRTWLPITLLAPVVLGARYWHAISGLMHIPH
jgi:hypothetical protein